MGPMTQSSNRTRSPSSSSDTLGAEIAGGQKPAEAAAEMIPFAATRTAKEMTMANLNSTLAQAAELDDVAFAARFQPGKHGNTNGRSARDCPDGHVLLRQPASSVHDIRVTIPAVIMQGWKPVVWTDGNKKIHLLIDSEEPGLFVLRPMAHDAVGKGVFRLEQNTEDGQARFMTTRRYVGRQLGVPLEYVPFQINGTLAMMDLRKLAVFEVKASA